MSVVNYLKPYDRIFVDTASFLVDYETLHYPLSYKRNNISDSNERFLKKYPNKQIQNDFFLKILEPALLSLNKKIIITKDVIKEIEGHTNITEGKINSLSINKEMTKEEAKKYLNRLASRAENAKKIINIYQKNELCELFGGQNYPFTDNVFITVFFRFLTKYNMCLITQDKALARDIEKIKNFEAINYTKKINSFFICADNSFSLFKNINHKPFAALKKSP
tara:strand:+ start:373 stop:1038 length:666 start_codon:yes stop_codon:yes gene_type:complete